MDIRDIILIDGDETPSTSSLAMLPTASPRLGVSVTGKALVAQGTPAVDLTKKAAGSAAPQLANATSDKTSSNNNKSILDFFGRVPKGTTPTNGLKKTPTTGAAQATVVPMKRPLSDASHSAAVNSGSNTSSGMTGSDSSAESPPKIMSTANAPPLSVSLPPALRQGTLNFDGMDTSMHGSDFVIVNKTGPSQFLTPAVSLPLLPRPSKAKMEDLDLPLDSVLPLPVLPMVPKTKGLLSMDEKMQLWTLVAFFQDFGVEILRIKAHQVPDLELMESMVCHPPSKYEDLLFVYGTLYAYLKRPKTNEVTYPTVPDLMARLFAATPPSEHTEQNVEALATLFASQDIETILPSFHVEALTVMLNLILESKQFRDYMQNLDEAINETRRNHYERLNEKRGLETQAVAFSPIIDKMDKDIERAEATLNAAYLDDDAVSVSGSSHNSSLTIDLDLASTQNRQEAKRKLQEKKARIAELKRDMGALIKERNGYVSSADSIQRKLSKIEKDDEEYPAKLEKLKNCIRGDSLRLLGLDREGKRYWNIELRQETAEEDDSDDSGPLPEIPVGGVMTETVFYDVMEVTEIAEEDSAQKKNSSKVKKIRKRKESDDDSEGTDETGSSYHDDGDEYSSDLSVAVEGAELAKSQAQKRTVLKLGIESVYGYVDSKNSALRLSRSLHERGIRESSLKKKLLAFVQETDKKNAAELTKNSIYVNFSSWCLGETLVRNNISPQVQNFSAYMFEQIRNSIPMICAAFELEMPVSDPRNLQDCLQLIDVWIENPKARKIWTLTHMTREAKNIKTLAALIYWYNRIETIGVQIHEQDEANRKNSSSQSRSTQSDYESASLSDAPRQRNNARARGARKAPKAKKKKAVARRSSRKVIAKTYKESDSDESSASESSVENDKSGSTRSRVLRIDSSDESQEEEESGQDSNGSRRTTRSRH